MDVIQAFNEYLVSLDRSSLTCQGYIADLKYFAQWFEETFEEKFAVQNITVGDIRQYRQYLTEVKRYKASTVNRRLISLSVFLQWARSTSLIDSNPAEHIRMINVVQPGVKYLNRKELSALQRTIEKDLQLARLRYPKRWRTRRRDASLVIFLLNTGLRISEALNLRLDDLEISERKGVLTVYGKGGKYRKIPLNAEARKVILEWLSVRPESDHNPYVWTSTERLNLGGPITQRSAQRIVRRYGQDAGIHNLTPHMLRHTFAKNLIDQDVGLEKVAALLGHSNLNTTRIYITPNERDLAQAVEKLT